jgi:hypothetical protein
MDKRYNIKSLELSTYIYFNNVYDNSSHLEDEKILLSNDTNLFVFPNDDNDNLNNSYRNIYNYVYEIKTHSDFLCKGVSADYITDSFNQSDAVIVIGEKGIKLLPNGNILAFALLKFNESTNSLYIDVICSQSGTKYSGEYLIKEIERISKILYITKITLKSVSSAISFYEKYGFVKIRSCDDNNSLCYMKKNLENKMSAGKRRKTYKNKKSLKKKLIKRKKTNKRLIKFIS